MCGSIADKAMMGNFSEILVSKKFDVLALRETKLESRFECNCGVFSGRNLSVVEGWARQLSR